MGMNICNYTETHERNVQYKKHFFFFLLQLHQLQMVFSRNWTTSSDGNWEGVTVFNQFPFSFEQLLPIAENPLWLDIGSIHSRLVGHCVPYFISNFFWSTLIINPALSED